MEEPPYNDGGQGQPNGPRIGGDDRRSNNTSIPVGVYSVDASGYFVIVSESATAIVDADVLSAIKDTVLESGDEIGQLSSLGLVYQKRTVDDRVFVAFADESYISGWKTLAGSLAISGLFTLAVFFVIAMILSRWALKPVEEAWESQRQFVADASHELKTPLTVILANTSILLKHPEQSIANQSQWVESTQVEAESMQGLVNEMLELAQVESRAAVLHEPLDFSELVNGQVLQFESVAFERGCTFEDDIEDAIMVDGDAERLCKMVSTLVENALKYVDEGGAASIGLHTEKDKVLLTVANTGSVISAEDLPHIFDRFYRTDKARTSGAGGYGLGLAIAREIAREHNGDITCTSGESGTTFTVTLPLA